MLDAADEFGVPVAGDIIDLTSIAHSEAQGLGSDGNHALIKALENLAGFEVSAQG